MFVTTRCQDNADRTDRGSAARAEAQGRFSGPPARAVVKWYRPDLRFGFVALADGSGDAFLHADILEQGGAAEVPEGATLQVRVGPEAKGLKVTEVVSIDISTAPPPRRPIQANRTEVGTVRFWDQAKQFGFIGFDHGGVNAFVGRRCVVDKSGIDFLTVGMRVEVDVADTDRGPAAVTIRLLP